MEMSSSGKLLVYGIGSCVLSCEPALFLALSASHSAIAAAAFARVSGFTPSPPAAHFLHWEIAVAIASDSGMPRSWIRSLAIFCMKAGSCMPLWCQRPCCVWPTFSCASAIAPLLVADPLPTCHRQAVDEWTTVQGPGSQSGFPTRRSHTMSTPTQPGWAPPQPPTTPPRKRHIGRNIALAVVGLFILGGVISAISGGGTTAPSAITYAPAATEGPTSPSAATVAEAPAATAAPA